jgi:hypothetical protein
MFMNMKRGNKVAPHVQFLIAAAALLYLAGCAYQAPLSLQGKSLSGYVRLTQAQVAFPSSYIGNGETGMDLGGAGSGMFHVPVYVEKGRLNVGSGVLDYQGREYRFDIRGLGAGGIGITNIQANGEVYGLERLRDLSGAYVSAPEVSTVNTRALIQPNRGIFLKNANGVIMRLQEQRGAIMTLAGDAVMIKMKQ